MTFSRTKNNITFSALAMLSTLLSGCNDQVSVDSVDILQTYSGNALNGRIVLGSKAFSFDGKSNVVESIDTSGASAEKAIIDFYLPSNPYLPHDYSRKATIHAQISLRNLDPKSTQVTPVVDEALVLVNDREIDNLDCKPRISVSAKDKKLSLKIDQVGNLVACVKQNASLYDASKLGKRDVSNNTSIFKPNYYTEAQDVSIGSQFSAEFIEKNKAVIVSNDHPMVQYLQRRMDQIAVVSDRPDLKPKVHVINSNVVNAFALPGGDIFFFRGLLESCRNEAELLGVAGHEWAHVTSRHGTKNLSLAQLTVAGMFISAEIAEIVRTQSRDEALKRITDAAKSVVLAGGQAHLLNESRESENEADILGSQYAMSAGFEPWGMAGLFEQLEKNLNADVSTTIEFASSGTHPTLSQRTQNVINLNAFFYPLRATYERSSLDFDKARASLPSLGDLPSKNQSAEIAAKFGSAVNALVLREVSTNVLDQFIKQPVPQKP